MVVQILTVTFWTVFSALGFSTLFNMIETAARQRAGRKHLIGAFRQEVPLVVFVSILMILMRVMNRQYSGSSVDSYWLLINVQVVFMMYADLMVQSIWSFLIIKVFAAISFANTGGMTILVWVLFVASGLVIFMESHYSRSWSPDNPILFALPTLITDAGLWTLMSFGWHPGTTVVVCNYIGCMFAVFALFLNSRNQRLDQQIVARLTHEVQFDALTGVRNWAMFQEDFRHAYSSVKKLWPLGIIAMDLDHFKAINDTHGHLAGNKVLSATATRLSQVLTAIDPDYYLYRTGGEEFAIILPHTTLADAEKVARQCQLAVRNQSVMTTRGPLTLTASFGLVEAATHDRDATNAFRRADQALYRSKHAGRDCLTVNEETRTD